MTRLSLNVEAATGTCEGRAGPMHYIDFGGTGPVIVALHGVTGNAYLWQGFAEALRDDFRVIAFDFRGHGDSAWSDSQAYSTADHVEDLRCVLDGLGIGPAILAGSSWGALAAMSLAVQFPERVTDLLIIDVEPSFEASPDQVHPRPATFDTYDELLAWERRANPNAPEEALRAYSLGSVRRVGEGGYRRKHDPFFFTRWPFRADDRWSELGELAVPVLIVRGQQSFVRTEVCRRMADACKGARFAEIANSGHLVPLEQPVELARIAKGFLEEKQTAS